MQCDVVDHGKHVKVTSSVIIFLNTFERNVNMKECSYSNRGQRNYFHIQRHFVFKAPYNFHFGFHKN